MNLLDIIAYLKDPNRTQQVQGLGGLLEDTLSNMQRKSQYATNVMEKALPDPSNLGKVGDRGAYKEAANMAFDALSFAPAGLTVYHGSPAKFTQFDASKIGSGEGAQAYGYGHYVAESPEVAREYQKNVSSDLVEPAKRALQKAGGNVDDAIQAANNEIKRLNALDLTPNTGSAKRDALVAAQMSTIDELNKFKKSGDWTAGSLYEIDLPDEQIAKMLDWDKPLSELPQKIQQSIYNDLTDAGYAKAIVNDLLNRKTGMELYKTLYKGMEQGEEPAINLAKKLNLGEQGMMMEAPALASESLRRMGIPGIRYLDQGSRGVGQGTSNFVVFPGNEGLLTIQKRNNEVIAPKGLLDTSPKLSEPVTPQSLLDYRGSHTAPGPDFGAPLHDLTGGGQMYPADVYSSKAVQYYGTGYPKADKEAFAIAMRVKGNPDAEVTMYRAVPNDKSITNINEGDWVTLSKDYAKTHGESALQGNYKIISKKVKAKELYTNADSIHEFGYWPQ